MQWQLKYFASMVDIVFTMENQTYIMTWWIHSAVALVYYLMSLYCTWFDHIAESHMCWIVYILYDILYAAN